jgi:hypothetical protein
MYISGFVKDMNMTNDKIILSYFHKCMCSFSNEEYTTTVLEFFPELCYY